MRMPYIVSSNFLLMIFLFTKKPCQLFLQEDLSSIYEWFRLQLLNLNPLKCEQHIPSTFNYTLAGQHIPLKLVIHFLGMLINSHLKWGDHVKFLTAKATYSLDYLRHTLFSCPTYVKQLHKSPQLGQFLSNLHLFGIYTPLKIHLNQNHSRNALHVGYAEVDGSHMLIAGPNLQHHV